MRSGGPSSRACGRGGSGRSSAGGPAPRWRKVALGFVVGAAGGAALAALLLDPDGAWSLPQGGPSWSLTLAPLSRARSALSL